VLLLRRERSISKEMCFIIGQQRAGKKALQLVFEADLAVGNRKTASTTECGFQVWFRQQFCNLGVPIAEIRFLTTEYLVSSRAT
jgi:hypothetical protein